MIEADIFNTSCVMSAGAHPVRTAEPGQDELKRLCQNVIYRGSLIIELEAGTIVIDALQF